jgi:hypothetical protein
VVTYTGEVLYRDEHDWVSPAGEYTLYRVLGGLASDHGENLFDVCDAHSQELYEVYAAVFDPATGDFRDEVSRKFDCVEADLLVIDSLTLDPKWRGLRLGLLVLGGSAAGAGAVPGLNQHRGRRRLEWLVVRSGYSQFESTLMNLACLPFHDHNSVCPHPEPLKVCPTFTTQRCSPLGESSIIHQK